MCRCSAPALDRDAPGGRSAHCAGWRHRHLTRIRAPADDGRELAAGSAAGRAPGGIVRLARLCTACPARPAGLAGRQFGVGPGVGDVAPGAVPAERGGGTAVSHGDQLLAVHRARFARRRQFPGICVRRCDDGAAGTTCFETANSTISAPSTGPFEEQTVRIERLNAHPLRTVARLSVACGPAERPVPFHQLIIEIQASE